jgi:hypothetical protein
MATRLPKAQRAAREPVNEALLNCYLDNLDVDPCNGWKLLHELSTYVRASDCPYPLKEWFCGAVLVSEGEEIAAGFITALGLQFRRGAQPKKISDGTVAAVYGWLYERAYSGQIRRVSKAPAFPSEIVSQTVKELAILGFDVSEASVRRKVRQYQKKTNQRAIVRALRTG